MFVPVPSDLFFSKNDAHDVRLGDVFKSHPGQHYDPDDFVLLGYPDDEGIRLNGGRPGAHLGPDKIRQFLYKMTPPEIFFKSYTQRKFYDYGNLELAPTLSERHTQALRTLGTLHHFQSKVISLGGGHDYGYPDGAAFIQSYATPSQKPLIINFDAHLDVRPADKGFNSGTPFYRLKTEFLNKFDLLEIGLQPQCNSFHHWKWAHDHGIQTLSLEQIQSSNWRCAYNHPLIQKLTRKTPVFISFDIDALKASEAPGCSQSWMTGLALADCLQFLDHLYSKADIRGLGIYEVSPPLDMDFQTSKTAALLIHHFLFRN